MVVPSGGQAKAIRAALDKLGINADASDVSKEVGPCHRWTGERWEDLPPTRDYVNIVREKYRRKRKLTVSSDTTDIDVLEWI